MPNIKRYKVEHNWNDSCEVTLEVDHDILTHARAKEINDFWGDAEYRSRQAHGDLGAVVRLFGQRLTLMMMSEGGASFREGHEAGGAWSTKMRAEEGWGGEEDSAFATTNQILFGWCGIRVIAAEVDTPSFDDMILKQV